MLKSIPSVTNKTSGNDRSVGSFSHPQTGQGEYRPVRQPLHERVLHAGHSRLATGQKLMSEAHEAHLADMAGAVDIGMNAY
jgi:hypothetical protein